MQRILTYLQHLREQLQRLYQFCKLDADVVVAAFDSWFYQQWSGLPNSPRLQSVTSGQIAHSTYDGWFACASSDQQQSAGLSADSPAYLHSSEPINRQRIGFLLWGLTILALQWLLAWYNEARPVVWQWNRQAV